MGTSRNSHELSKKLATFGTVGVPAAVAGGVRAASEAAQRELTGVLVTQKALKWANMRRGKSFVSRKVTPRMAAIQIHGAPAHVRERGAPPHIIAPKRRTAKTRRAGLSIPGIGVRRSAKHPGIRAAHYFRPAAAVVAAQTGPIAKAEFEKQLIHQFRR